MIILIKTGDGSLQIPSNFRFVSLSHPKSGIDLVFAIVDERIMEIQSVQPRRHGSWFIDQRISSEGSLYLASKFDPRFLILPYLEKESSRFCPLDQIIGPKVPITGASSWKLEEICDVNDKYGDDMIFYRYNESKTVNWLKSKVERTALALATQRQKHLSHSSNCVVNSFNISLQSQNKSSSTGDAPAITTSKVEVQDVDLKSAIGIISDYLSDTLTSKLFLIYNINNITEIETKELKRKADWELQLEIERETLPYAASTLSKQTPSTSSANSNMMEKKSKASGSSKAKPVLTAPTGTKSITNFFTKK